MNAMAATTEKTNTISVNEMRDYVLNVANGDGSSGGL